MLTAFGLNTNINHEDDMNNGVGDKTHDLSGGCHGHVNPLIGNQTIQKTGMEDMQGTKGKDDVTKRLRINV